MPMPTGITSHQELSEFEQRDRVEKGLAIIGRRTLQVRISQKKMSTLRRKLGAVAYTHFHDSPEELKRELSKVFEEHNLIVTEKDVVAELKKMGAL